MSDKLINEKLAELEKTNDAYNAQVQVLQGKVSEAQKQMAAIREEQVRLQGEYRVLNELKSFPKETDAVEEKAVEPKKKSK